MGERPTCRACGKPLNHHANKLDRRALHEGLGANATDAEGAVDLVYTCPNCGGCETMREQGV